MNSSQSSYTHSPVSYQGKNPQSNQEVTSPVKKNLDFSTIHVKIPMKSCFKQDTNIDIKSNQVETLETPYDDGTETEQDFSDESSLDIETEVKRLSSL